MRSIAIALLLAVLPTLLDAQGATGGLAGGVRVAGSHKGFPFVTIRARPATRRAEFGGVASLYREGPFYISRLPVGHVDLCVTAIGYHTIFDSVEIKKNSVARREFVLEPDIPLSEPYPDCDRSIRTLYIDPVDSAGNTLTQADAFAIWDAALRYYRRDIHMTEGDFVQMTFRMTGSSADTVGPVLLAVKLNRTVTPSPEFFTWFDSLVPRALVPATCDQIDVKECPQEQMTTYLSFPHPKRLHADTVEVVVDEVGVNPGTCRTKGNTFMGFWERRYIAAINDGRWEVVGRSSTPGYTSTGICGPSQ
jgi:hypothetical protein